MPKTPALPTGPEEAAAATAPPGPRAPTLYDWIDIDGYDGYRAKVWINAPLSVNRELSSGDGERITAVLKRLVVEHNDWSDADGNPLPTADDPTFWEEVDGYLFRCVLQSINKAAWRSPLVKAKSER